MDWVTTTLAFGGNPSSLVFDSQGYARIAYQHGSNLKYAYEDDGGWHFETIGPMTAGGTNCLDLALDSDENPHISYYYLAPYGYSGMRYVYHDEGGWHFEIVDGQWLVGLHNSIAIDSFGNPHIAYYANSLYSLRYASRIGGSWSLETADADGHVGISASLAIDSTNHPHISHQRGFPTYNLKYTCKNNGGWYSEIVDAVALNSQATSLVLDNYDYPHISYTTGILKYAYWTGSAWDIQAVNNESSGWSSMALDFNGNPCISYYYSSAGNLKYAYWEEEVWNIETVDSPGNVGGFTSLAMFLNENQKIGISYYNYSGSLKYATLFIPLLPPPIPITYFLLA